MEGRRVNKLYQLSLTVIPNPALVSEAHVATTSSVVKTTDLALISSSYCNNNVLWHERMGHISFATMQKMALEGSLINFQLPKLKNFQLQHPCKGCQYGKHTKSNYLVDPQKQRAEIPGSFIHGDLLGKITPPSLAGSQYYILYKDISTAYRFIHFAKDKSEAFVFFKRVVKQIKRDIGIDVIKL
jgi:hypothetical protein